ncbi:DUF3097 domain-containing protein [Actinokineospora bangkokensis]|uniref:DUF3097 domain-containing protein n=1 Tax=Actinokineospora bangkokensis TaxID=1193682 RepID=A0A1Q9LP66_9PSEU|nr:DUF3097 domain-containing protein [Actinokineospora bangkokensis]OLR93808.1 hypothetical protein BJP25_16375 [Actinokineospora bangkokensis]
MRPHDYRRDILKPAPARAIPQVPATPGTVVEDPATGFCGAVVRLERDTVVLEDRHGRHRVFPLTPAGFLLDGRPVTLVRPAPAPTTPARRVSASGSVRVEGLRARTARASRIWVEGVHDAELVERVWGHDLRVEGIVVEPLDGVDHLPAALAAFGTSPLRRVGVLVDHLVAGSKETRLVDTLDDPNVLVTGHPYVDIWEAVTPAALGIDAWPRVPRGLDWKQGVCDALGWGDPAEGWRRVRAAVTTFRDVQPPLIGAVERLIDFVTEPAG